MKKVLLTAILAASAVAVVASAKSFDGTYAGLKASYIPAFTNTEARYSIEGSSDGVDVDLKNWEGDLLFGQWSQSGDWSLAVEGNVGRGLSNSSKEKTVSGRAFKIKTQRLWKVGVTGRAGKLIANETLLYGRLGLQGSQFQSKLGYVSATNAFSKDMRFFSWTITPGVGVEWALSDKACMRFEYTYEYSFNRTSTAIGNAKIGLNNPQVNTLSLGVTYAL
jgi:opacity protein-like surface antigen